MGEILTGQATVMMIRCIQETKRDLLCNKSIGQNQLKVCFK